MRKPFHQDWKLTQGFGGNKPNYVQFGLEGHNGLDYGLPNGTDVLAPHSGKIIEVINEGTKGYGLYVKIENDKEGSVLAHLRDVLVSVGTSVSEGQLIAHSNNTGNSTGPHLHWGYYKIPRNRQNGYNGYIDQLPLLQGTPVVGSPDLQKELDKVRAERDKNWNLYQDSLKEIEKLKKITPSNPLHEDVLLQIQRQINRLM